MNKRMMEQQLRRSSRNNASSTNVGKSSCDDESGNQHSDDMSEDELKRKRLEQEKADRLLAEEMQREERKARIHLRERRGGGGGGSVTSSGTSRAGNSNGSKSSGRKTSVEKVNKKRMTNNSMAACLPPVMEIDSNTNSAGETTPPRQETSRSPSPCAPTPASNKSKIPQSQTNDSAVLNPKKKKYEELDKNNSESESKNRMSKTKVKSSVLFSQNEEDVIIGMHKVIEAMKNHRDAWPFVNPVDEDYAPNYYRVISQPMDLQAIEDKLDNQEYSSLEEFKVDFQKIVDNCRKYNGPSSEYTEMVENLQDAFNKAIQRYIVPDESDEEISIEYNTGNERKRPRMSNNPKSPTKIVEHKKENEPHNTKVISSKSKLDKHDKKKRKQQLMRHHSRNSEAMDALTSATAETLKDINKWLGDTPKISEYSSSSPHSVSSDNLVLRSEEREEEKRPAKLKHGAVKKDSKKKLQTNRDRDSLSSVLPSNNQSVSKEKLKAKKSKGKEKSKEKDKEKDKDPLGSSSSVGSSKEKHHHHHHHHKHHRHRERGHTSNSKTVKDRSASPETSSVTHHKSNKSQESSKSLSSRSHSPHNSKSLNHSQGVNSQRENDKNEPAKKIAETLKPKSSVKRGNSLMMGLKNSGTIKRLQGSKLGKFSANQDSKFKTGGSNPNPASVYDFVVGNNSYSKSFASSSEFSVGLGVNSTGNNGSRESVEKKKCLLINDSPGGKEGGPRLSLGSVLSTDAIKLGDFKKNEECSDDEDSAQREVDKLSKNNRFDDLRAKVQSKISTEEIEENAKSVVKNEEETAEKDTKKEEEEAEAENDRKLEPSKGFNREKCMPNLSAWIKAFGGPPKSSAPSSSSCTGRKSEGDPPKSKFKVLGRGGPVDLPEERTKNPSGKLSTMNSTTAIASKGKSCDSQSKNQCSKSSPDNCLPGNAPTVSDETCYSQSYDHHSHHGNSSSSSKRHRSRKMSTSSLSSQSESGSPSCFAGNNDDISSRMAVINPPRWVDEHWASQSQSPSASSHVSSQSPAGPNSPFSPPMSSPPRTPQTPPWPAAPVRVGFYQDITSQHSSPEKMTDSNSNAASPSTPPGGSNGSSSSGGAPSSRDNPNINGKNYAAFPPGNYAPRYATGIPSPSIGPASNLPSPSGINTNVDSPGSRSLSMGSVGSPHSPNVTNNGAVHASDFRVNLSNNPSTSPNMHHPMTPQPSPVPLGPPSGGQDSQSKTAPSLSPVMRTTSRSGAAINLNTNSQGLSVPYPVTSVNSSGNYMMESNASHSHGHSPHPENAHVHHHQSIIPQGPPRYAHSLVPAHHQQSSLSPSPGLPSVSGPTASLHAHTQGLSRSAVQGLPPVLSSSNLSSSQPQPSPYPSNPYTSNPRSINVAPNVYNNPIASENRFYKPGVSSGDVNRGAGSTVTVTSTSSSSSSSSTNSRSRKNAAAAAAQINDSEGGKSSSVAGTVSSIPAVSSAAAVALESAKLSSELNVNGFQWPHNLASLSQIVNSIPNPMAVGVGVSAIPNAYRAHYEQNVAGAVENMSKFSRSEPSSYTSIPVTTKSSGSSSSGTTNSHNLPEKGSACESGSERRSSSKSDSKTSRSQGSSTKSSSQPIVPGSAFNFSALAPEIALYSKEMPDPSSLYTASPPALAHHHRPDLYPTSTANFHTTFAAASAARTTAGGVPTASITPYQIPPFIGSHPSPYQPQSVSSQPFAHSQSPRGIVDPYQQFFQGSPHVMGLLPPSGYSAPYAHPHHSLGFNRPGWI